MLPALEVVGIIASTHGYKGDVVLNFSSKKASNNILKGHFLFVLIDEKGVPFFIEETKSNNTIVKLRYINSEIDAQKLIHCQIAIESKQTSKKKKTNTESIINFKLYSTNLQEIGKIERIENYPAGPMLILKKGNDEILIPFVEDWIVQFDPKEKIIIADIPEGLVE